MLAARRVNRYVRARPLGLSREQEFYMLNLNIGGIPPELKQYPQWILWCRTEDKENNRFGKRPCNEAGFAISATSPKNWLPFHIAVDQLGRSKQASGIGICLSGQPIEGSGVAKYLVGIDIDNCVTASDGAYEMTSEAAEIVRQMDSYIEVSPSGTGMRGFFYTDHLPTSRNANGKELYSAGRFLTVTGVGEGQLRFLGKPEVEALQALMFGTTTPHTKTRSNGVPTTQPAPTETPENVAKLKAALDAIPAGIGRDQWVRVVMSVKAHGFSCSEEMARAWSATAGTRQQSLPRFWTVGLARRNIVYA